MNQNGGAGKVLTVSVAAYNVEPCLMETLESCVVPNMDLLEVIVVDDGSTDGTSGVAQRFVDRYPSTFRLITKENGGYGSTVNASLAAARGKYFRYLDGDDWVDDASFERYLNLLVRCDEEAVFTPYARHYEVEGFEKVTNDLDGVPVGRLELEGMDFNRAIAGCALAYKTEFLRRISFEMIERCFYTDIQFAYEPLAFARDMFVSDVNFYRYRIGREGQSVSRESIARHYKDIECVRARVLTSLLSKDGTLRDGVTCGPYVWRALAKEVAGVYGFVCMAPPSVEALAKLKEFDALAKRYPRVYEDSASRSRLVRLLRMSRFALYRPLCWLTSWRAG